ncbi:MAG: flagellar hook-associated protein FlgK [Syntrophomonadaceae bacterium]|jgi:flagellar hook-associated protein 1 FlgK
MSNFFSLEIGRRALLTHQTALSITGHNIANADTPGYSRQVAEIVTSNPWHAPAMNQSGKAGQLGTGVDIAAINRIRDEFIDAQIRHENRADGYWAAMQETLSQIEVIINEPSEDGLRAAMDMFWESWQDLVANPESEAVRTVTLQRGMALADAIKHTYQQLSDLRFDVNSQVTVKVDEINSLALQIADLNRQIMAIGIAGKQPNDLMDKRDLLIDQLSRIADVTLDIDCHNMVSLRLGGSMLVDGGQWNQLATIEDAYGMDMVVWKDNESAVIVKNGELRGLLDTRGKTANSGEVSFAYKEIIPGMIDDLEALAQTLAERINGVHSKGFSLNNKTSDLNAPDGINFFEYDPNKGGAASIQVNQSIQDDVKNIAAAAAPVWDNNTRTNFGDGNNALKIAQLKHDLNKPEDNSEDKLKINNMTIDDFWRSVAADIGVLSQEAQRMVLNQGALLKELENKRQSFSGVSLDEEMINMVKFQHAYNGASRYITAIDEALEVVINRMGLVGR